MIWKDCAPWTNTTSLVKMFIKSGVCQKLFGIVRNTELCLQIHVGWLGRSGGVWVCWLVPLLGIPWEGQTVPTGLTTDPHHPVHGPHPPLQPHHPLHGQQGCRHPQGRQQDRLSWAWSLPVCQNHFFPIFSESPHSLSLYLLSLHLPVKHILTLNIWKWPYLLAFKKFDSKPNLCFLSWFLTVEPSRKDFRSCLRADQRLVGILGVRHSPGLNRLDKKSLKQFYAGNAMLMIKTLPVESSWGKWRGSPLGHSTIDALLCDYQETPRRNFGQIREKYKLSKPEQQVPTNRIQGM